jgi:hypothetical protein
VKLWKWHTLVFRCPCCGKEAEYAAQIIEGPNKGNLWDPAYWCEKCSTPVRARDTWLFGGVYGPLLAMVATFAFEAIPPAWGVAQPVAILFAGICCGIIGWPLSRALSRRLLYWEPRNPRDPRALRQARLRQLQDEDE